ncbi:cytochrome C [Sediminimonas sp.]|uniref:c-type cytochrome n=1 Tax=Sediminimonas sp. TaxID=2823379 RepID=UPI0025D82473|nr:cytochrome C [Sediminimonas sp.]
MRTLLTTAALLTLAAPAFAEGDAAKGEKEFRKCKACHMIVDDAGETIVRGGRTGPNLYGVIGRVAGSVEDFRYGPGLEAAAEDEFVWTEEEVAEYVADPSAWLESKDYPKRSKMTFRLRKGGEDVAAYLTSVAE